MKRLLFIIIISAFLLFSCQKEDAIIPTTVFMAKDKSPISCEINPARFFPACHGGRVIGHTHTDNDYIIQEEIISNNNVVTQYWCNIFDTTGTRTISITPATDIGYDLSRDNIALGEVFHLIDSLYIERDNANIFLFLTPEGLCAYTEKGDFKWYNNALIAEDIFIYENSIFILNATTGKQEITKVNLNDGEILENYNFDGQLIEFEALGENDTIFVGTDAHIYATNALGLYQLNIQENKKSVDIRPIVDWSLSNILPGIIKSINVIDEENIEIIQSDILTDELNRIKYVRATDKELEANDVILAVFTTRNDYQLPVYYYNQEPQNEKINLRNYSAYEQEQQILRFNTDVAAGDSPDMVIMWQNDTLNSTISMYERAGIFSDLIPLLRNNGSIKYDDLLTYVTEPYKLNEKQYIFPLNPSVECYFGSTVYFDGPVTIDEYLNICSGNNLGSLNSKRLFSASIDDFYDEATAKCSFNNGILAQQMTRSSLLLENSNAQPLNQITFAYTTLFNFAETMISLEGDWVPVGYPNEKAELCMGNSLAEYYAILESSTHKDTAVDFLHTLILNSTTSIDSTETEDRVLLSMCYGYTFYKSDIYKQLDYFMDKTIVIDGINLSVYADNDPGLSKANGFHLKITQSHADSMFAFLNTITRRVNNASPVQKIFWEEYWAMDDRPIETMLDYVQSKVSLYLSEQMD